MIERKKKYSIYKNERRKARDVVHFKKKNGWDEFGVQMEKNSKENQKLFYRTLKTLREDKTKPSTTVKDKEGTLITEGKLIMERTF